MSEALTATEATPAAPDGAVVVSGAQDAAASVPAAGEAPAASGTLLGSDPVEKPVAAPADWPEDWRTKVAGEDAKEIARLQRMGSPADVWKAYRALEAKISSGQLKQGLKPDATPEEIKTWRAENGLPESPEGYKPQLPNGMIPGEADAPLVEWFKTVAHETNMAPEQFNGVLSKYFQYQDDMQAQAFAAEMERKSAAEEELRAEWGHEFKPNIAAAQNIINAFAPAGFVGEFMDARMPDGTRVGNDPRALRLLVTFANQINPYAKLVPAGTTDPMKAGEARIQEIEEVQRTDNRRYWNDPKMQAEYGELLAARIASQNRAA
jgi:hypothetical protein